MYVWIAAGQQVDTRICGFDMNNKKLPVAIITNSLGYVIETFSRDHGHKVASYHFNARRIYLKDESEYVIISKPEQLLGLEISSYELLINPQMDLGFNLPSMVELAKQRMR